MSDAQKAQVRGPGVVRVGMGDVVSLLEHPRFSRTLPAGDDLAVPERPPVRFAFDLASPFTYLAAERLERHFGDIEWQPVLEEATGLPQPAAALAEERAAALGLPLVWPDEGASSRAAMRVASLAVDHGCARGFVLAASRLAFCGGFELDDPEVIAEAAAVAGLGLDEALEAAHDTGRDVVMRQAAGRLVAEGAHRLPALVVGGVMFAGEDRLAAASAAFSGTGEHAWSLRRSAP